MPPLVSASRFRLDKGSAVSLPSCYRGHRNPCTKAKSRKEIVVKAKAENAAGQKQQAGDGCDLDSAKRIHEHQPFGSRFVQIHTSDEIREQCSQVLPRFARSPACDPHPPPAAVILSERSEWKDLRCNPRLFCE
jgi:hypothetical protein